MTLSVKDGAGLAADLVSRLVSGAHVIAHDFIPFATPDLTWFEALATNADTNYPSVDCQRFRTIWLEFIISDAGDPIGDLFIEWSFDDTTFYPFVIDSGKFSEIDPGGTDVIVVEALGKISFDDPATPARFAMGVEKPPPFMRGRWVAGTGGAATGAAGKSFGRG